MAQGFWSGFGAGFSRSFEAALERKSKERLFGEKELREKRSALLGALRKRQEEAGARKAEIASYQSWFNNRLRDVDPELRQAYVNLATQQPEVAQAIISGIEKFEEDKGFRVEGQSLIKFSDIVEQTRPEGMARDAWITTAATQLVPAGNTIDFDATLDSILGAESLEDLDVVETDFLTAPATTVPVVPDINPSAVGGLDPTLGKQLREQAEAEAQRRFQVEFEDLSFVVGADPSQPANPAAMERYNQLVRAREVGDQAVYDLYLPEIVPQLAEQTPMYQEYFPEYFNTQPAQPIVEQPQEPVTAPTRFIFDPETESFR